ncbi:MAG TPA: c-type cytochrome [Gemmatimonadales bacterium]|nr:c-type cytochrome [Gemmatimonadales bacterium]
MRNPIAPALLASIALAAATVPARAQEASTPPGVTDAAIAKGKEIFGKSGYCFACHGSGGKGAIGPDLTDAEWLHSTGGYEEIVATITKGVSKEESKGGNVMPPKGGADLSEEDVRAVAAYVWSLSHPTR